MNNSKLLAATMIMKNESKNLRRCLDSIKDVCDAIFIMDTGSTDDSIDIALSYGAKVIQSEWKYDFSFHRNAIMDYAEGYEWFLILDCDETIEIPDPKEFRRRLAKIDPEINALCVMVGEMEDNGKQSQRWPGVRFFRAAGNPRYKYIVHNKVKYEGHAAGTDIILNHYGYKEGNTLKKKYERTKDLLERRLKADPKDFIAMYYIAQISVGEGNWTKAIEYCTKALENCTITDPRDFQYFGVVYYWAAYAYLAMQDGVNAFPWIVKGLECYPDDIDLNYIMSQYCFLTDQEEPCLEHAEKYKQALKKSRDESQKNTPQPFVRVIDDAEMQKRISYCSTDEHLIALERWCSVYE